MRCVYKLTVLILIWFLCDSQILFSFAHTHTHTHTRQTDCRKICNKWPKITQQAKKKIKVGKISCEFECLCHCLIHILPSIENVETQKKGNDADKIQQNRTQHEDWFLLGAAYILVTVSTKSWGTNVLLFIGNKQNKGYENCTSYDMTSSRVVLESNLMRFLFFLI